MKTFNIQNAAFKHTLIDTAQGSWVAGKWGRNDFLKDKTWDTTNEYQRTVLGLYFRSLITTDELMSAWNEATI